MNLRLITHNLCFTKTYLTMYDNLMRMVLIFLLGTILFSACTAVETSEPTTTSDQTNQTQVSIIVTRVPPTPEPALTAVPSITPTSYPQIKPGIAAGDHHTCYLDAGGSVMCWGWNRYGQTGMDSADHVLPGNWLNLPHITQISAGGYHSCAVTSEHQVFCWGRNNAGQLGNGSYEDSNTPVQVQGLEDARIDSVVCGSVHTCAFETGGSAWCWGSNRDGKLGAELDAPFSNTAVQVAAPVIDIQSLSTGATFTCAADQTAQTWCWGDGSFGQIGSRNADPASSPREIEKAIPGVNSISSGWFHTCALTDSGDLFCWGKNYEGELGNSSTISRAEAVNVVGLTGKKIIRQMSMGGRSGCAVTTDNELFCWGKNDYGQVGNRSTTDQLFPALIDAPGEEITSLSVGASHACYLTSQDDLFCWGANDHLQLGISSPEISTFPTLIELQRE